jgi:hypothetical protein
LLLVVLQLVQSSQRGLQLTPLPRSSGAHDFEGTDAEGLWLRDCRSLSARHRLKGCCSSMQHQQHNDNMAHAHHREKIVTPDREVYANNVAPGNSWHPEVAPGNSWLRAALVGSVAICMLDFRCYHTVSGNSVCSAAKSLSLLVPNTWTTDERGASEQHAASSTMHEYAREREWCMNAMRSASICPPPS